MRSALKDAFREVHGRVVRPGHVGAQTVPADEEAMVIVRQLADDAVASCSSGLGCFPGTNRAGAVIRYGLGLTGPRRDGTFATGQAAWVAEKFRALCDARPDADRLRRAIFLALVHHQACVSRWENPTRHYIGAKDPEFVRTCRVAAARMLSQGQLWQVVLRPDNRAGLLRVEWPDNFWA